MRKFTSIGVRPMCVSEPELRMQERAVETLPMNVAYKNSIRKNLFSVSTS